MDMRNKLKVNQEVQPGRELKTRPIRKTDNMRSVYYDNEFRKWHYKLALIMVGCVAMLYALVIGLSGLLSGV